MVKKYSDTNSQIIDREWFCPMKDAEVLGLASGGRKGKL